jgi:hypothetical protein
MRIFVTAALLATFALGQTKVASVEGWEVPRMQGPPTGPLQKTHLLKVAVEPDQNFRGQVEI